MPFFCIHCRSEIDPKFKACPYCGEPITDFLRRYLETPVDGKYQILARLGVGGMGEVYKVLHVHLNSIRVIKLMRPAIAGDRSAHDRFLREARMATKITHPNVASLFDFSTLDDGSWYMVWEYIEGTNLHDLIEERGPLSPRYTAKLAIQALTGLEAIHRAGIVHRDVSPENLMITRDSDGEERVKIIDLGIAKQWTEDADDKTKTGIFVGKWKYCSPEHLGMLTGQERIDGRADIYSFGIVMYEMLTGVAPFHADTPHGYLMLHASEKPRPLRELNPSVAAAPELELLLLRALEKDRAKRFASAREFAQALEAVLTKLSDTPGAPPPLPSAAEATEEPTRVVPRIDPNAPTVASVAQPQLAETIPATQIVVPRRRRPIVGITVAAAAVIAVVVGSAAMLNRSHPQPQKQSSRPARANVLVTAPGHLAINAFPWANVTSIRNLATGVPVEIDSPLITPAPVELAPGRYEITLSNPRFKQPMIRIVEIAAGQEALLNVQFTEPRTVRLPVFE
ncbi:MAG TPA: serine/threonine-protein kinase [Thermoanaerobaculia bacterium]|jgi:serine/threonine-protein kinase|nr:serine/threonine-protein kinase [Thermoanaerobaculia bacterium]